MVPIDGRLDEKIVLEKRFFHDLVPVAPSTPYLVCWKEGLNAPVRQLLKNLLLVTRSSVKRKPTAHQRTFRVPQ